MQQLEAPPAESGGRATVPLPLFAINAAESRDSYVIRVEGELDLDHCPGLESALETAEASQADRILLDLEKLTFIDAAGLSALLTACRRSTSDGDRLRVTRGNGDVADMFRLTLLDLTLPFAGG